MLTVYEALDVECYPRVIFNVFFVKFFLVTLHLCLKAMAKLSNRVMEKMIKYRFLISLPPQHRLFYLSPGGAGAEITFTSTLEIPIKIQVTPQDKSTVSYHSRGDKNANYIK